MTNLQPHNPLPIPDLLDARTLKSVMKCSHCHQILTEMSPYWCFPVDFSNSNNSYVHKQTVHPSEYQSTQRAAEDIQALYQDPNKERNSHD